MENDKERENAIKFMETYNNIRAFLISLFVWHRAISRRYDDWFYIRGKKISAYQIKLNHALEMQLLFGSDFVNEMEERKFHANNITLSEDGIYSN